MNSTVSPSNGMLSDSITGFHYFVGISVGVVILITSMVIASYYCTRVQDLSPGPPRRRTSYFSSQLHEHHSSVDIEVGLDEATLKSFPKLLYSEAKLRNKHATNTCCSICLADYNSTDTLRLLPDCGHLFHLKCVDPWLKQHPTCPVCRSSPIPTPLSTPLAEVAPLANQTV
ncbi:zinc finger protein [Macleaya cordata]|uniref:RING-type E3 ubiquitin transferase n=1 Tax=Macleaya cordata TaxID=56857 RepID=A0A200Q9Q0_MACCD|nr:zinc finger protein [Macleaya cordata]